MADIKHQLSILDLQTESITIQYLNKTNGIIQIENDKTLKELDLHLKKFTHLQELVIKGHLITDDHILMIIRIIKEHPLTHLDLSDNSLTKVGIETLSEALRNNNSIKTLNLGFNKCQDEEVQDLLSKTGSTMPNLEWISMTFAVLSPKNKSVKVKSSTTEKEGKKTQISDALTLSEHNNSMPLNSSPTISETQTSQLQSINQSPSKEISSQQEKSTLEKKPSMLTIVATLKESFIQISERLFSKHTDNKRKTIISDAETTSSSTPANKEVTEQMKQSLSLNHRAKNGTEGNISTKIKPFSSEQTPQNSSSTSTVKNMVTFYERNLQQPNIPSQPSPTTHKFNLSSGYSMNTQK